MELAINKFRIELNNIIQSYRERGIPSYVLSGILSQEMLRMKEWELAELTVAFDDAIRKSSDERTEDE